MDKWEKDMIEQADEEGRRVKIFDRDVKRFLRGAGLYYFLKYMNETKWHFEPYVVQDRVNSIVLNAVWFNMRIHREVAKRIHADHPEILRDGIGWGDIVMDVDIVRDARDKWDAHYAKSPQGKHWHAVKVAHKLEEKQQTLRENVRKAKKKAAKKEAAEEIKRILREVQNAGKSKI
jgi:hypothetical protein